MRWDAQVAKWFAIKKPRNFDDRRFIAEKLGYTYVGSGAGREVYLSPDQTHVVKLEYPSSDFPNQNRREAAHYKRWMALPYRKRKDGTQFAKCRLVPGIGIFMEAVDCLNHKESYAKGKFVVTFQRASKPNRNVKVPKWVMNDHSLDGWQVGFTRAGKLVVYDYGVVC